MIKPFLVSAVLHGSFITVILLASATSHESGASADNRIRVRIDSDSNRNHGLKSVENKGPPRDLSSVPRKAALDARRGDMGGESAEDNESIEELATLLDYEPLVAPRSKPDEPAQNVEAMDPPVNFDEQPGAPSSFRNPWMINWVEGRERRVLSFPLVDAAQFPQKTEKLLDVMIRIRVSPQGEVLSAELIPPGSGDTRIDRYIHGAALQLTLEPRLDNDRVQEAHLRLLFLEESL